MKWTTLTEVISRLMPPLVMLVLARILSPDDFGIIGVAMIAIGFAQAFQDFGLGKALIQRENDIDESANIVFWCNVLFGSIIYLCIFLSANDIAIFFKEPRVASVLRVLCLQIFITSLGIVHLSLLQRSFEFKKIFFVRFTTSLVPALISIPLALVGQGIWALVGGSLASSFLQIVLLWRVSNWRPMIKFNFKVASELFGFGTWVFLEMFLSWLIMCGDSIILGRFLGVYELGVYRVGFTFVSLIFAVLFNPFTSVAYSAFSRMQNSTKDLNILFLDMVRINTMISLPLGIFLAFTATIISSLIFGHKWDGIGVVIAIIGLEFSIGYLVVLNPQVYRAIGRPDANSKLLIANVFYFIPVYILAAPHGLLIFCFSRFLVSTASLGLHFYVANKILCLPYNYLGVGIKPPLIASIGMAICLYGIIYLITPLKLGDIANICIILSLGLLCYISILWSVDHLVLSDLFRLIKSAI